MDVKASTYLISSPNSVHNNNAEGQSNAESTGIHLSRNWIYLVEFTIKKFLTRCDCWRLYISILVKSGTYELFDCYKIPRLEPERNNAFFDFTWRMSNNYQFFWKFILQKCLQIVYKDSRVLETRPKFPGTAPFSGRICRFDKVLPRRGRMSDPRHYHDLSRKAHAQLFWESRKCWNVYNKSLQICKHVNKSTIL